MNASITASQKINSDLWVCSEKWALRAAKISLTGKQVGVQEVDQLGCYDDGLSLPLQIGTVFGTQNKRSRHTCWGFAILF